MKFFIPGATSSEQESEVFWAVKRHLTEQLGDKFSERRVFKVTYPREGKTIVAEVGKPHPTNGEIVVVIFHDYQHKSYHICTLNRGVATGNTIEVGEWTNPDVEDFE